MYLNRDFGNAQNGGCLLIQHSTHHQRQDLAFARCEVSEPPLQVVQFCRLPTLLQVLGEGYPNR